MNALYNLLLYYLTVFWGPQCIGLIYDLVTHNTRHPIRQECEKIRIIQNKEDSLRAFVILEEPNR